ncbi:MULTISPECIES: 4a-hydroxytetrahydrobiopterin dehydratase [unclassified Chelatococcus]|uniref:4a-hydroxytetrahydrobiopterin dehydratase n=1 Tax=unclassified Chelatococcus TaxID=2638111 RepID=UPI001BD0BF2F|nr:MULTISPECIES: 4a-hydroxytetrahydrobiopterin dehydratase [unclassified Chelatococcus]CAH1667073.1 4a-hydroxytetrahydrobiopterin dehydratase [Hyphomicrobiales bacterium]MBS7737979.1 4a-hydroxytetrahydrobiopterin dehydratase [Chelatococcus sp. HY11]MBX3546382.1 4a-hydroxytetrahydrobiopterin dehydratase [Chelatococcus sp.]MCO5077676.1 4a-hydroxytetrahydrobiopterin dehydratase [Chelatococcus sp.]CAH1680076.1 4a-hydroxytetrahydrobiopterin dehydratase [Hyphomicrobiales bacterium]
MTEIAIKPLPPQEVEQRLSRELPGWRLVDGEIRRRFATHGWKGSLMVANVIGHLAEVAWHHPDLVVSYGGVEVRLSTHSPKGITDRDFALAAQIDAVVLWRPAHAGILEGTPADPGAAYLKDKA